MDAGLAKVINSTVGTGEVVPFDKLLYGLKGLVPSTNEYFKIGTYEGATLTLTNTSTVVAQEAEHPLVSMKMWTDGGFSLSAVVGYGVTSNKNSYADVSVGLRAYKNGVKVAENLSKTATGDVDVGSTGSGAAPLDNIYFKKGDTIEVRLVCAIRENTKKTATFTVYGEINPSSNPIIIKATSVEKPFDIVYDE